MFQISMKTAPELDPEFVPAVLWNREYRKLVKASGSPRPLAICVRRANGNVSRFDTEILPGTPEYEKINFRYVERLVKFMLWGYGGWEVTIAGSRTIADHLRKIYSPTGERAFDYKMMGQRIYGHDFTVVGCAYEEAPARKEASVRLGGHFDGCRIGFDLGGSDRKCAAVKDGKTIHSEEVEWNPYFQTNIEYHREGILDSLRRAAAKLPRIDAIGGSAAGVYVDGHPRLASLFRGIPEEKFAAEVYPLFDQISQEFPGVPFIVLNDGEVTALAGAVSIGKNALLGLAMGTSEATGYVTQDGSLTDYLNELAFCPIDYRENDKPQDEWSGDYGVGALYLSQQAVGRIAGKAGFDFAAGTPLPEQLKLVQKAMVEHDSRAAAVYRTIGRYLGYAVAHYADFYRLEQLLLLGRVASGEGGSIILDEAQNVLQQEFPELHVAFHTPDEAFKRHGQAMIAASLPALSK